MHGIETIKQINNLAAENSPEFVERQLNGTKVHKGQPKLHQQMTEALEARAAGREKAIAELEKESFEELVARIEALELPSTLEAAVARKLKKALGLARFGQPGQHNQD